MTPPRAAGPTGKAMLGATLLLLAGCSTTVHGRDNDRIFPTIRAVFDLNQPLDGGTRAKPVSRFDHGLEIDTSGTAGEFNLDQGIGPTDYQVLHGSMAYRFGFAGDRLQIRGLTGLAIDRVDLSGNASATADTTYVGAMLGIEGRIKLREWFGPYARFTQFLLERGSYAQHLEVGLVFQPSVETEAFVAYRNWDAEYGNGVSASQDLDVEWRGMVLGFGIRL